MKYSKGFSMIEILVFISILVTFFVAALSVVTFTVRSMKVNEHKILALRYADELMEWMRTEKDSDWNNFVLKANASPYCFNTDLNITDTNIDIATKNIIWPSTGQCYFNADPDSTLGTYNGFKRQAVVTGSGAQMNIDITVSWQEQISGTNSDNQVTLSTKVTPTD